MKCSSLWPSHSALLQKEVDRKGIYCTIPGLQKVVNWCDHGHTTFRRQYIFSLLLPLFVIINSCLCLSLHYDPDISHHICEQKNIKHYEAFCTQHSIFRINYRRKETTFNASAHLLLSTPTHRSHIFPSTLPHLILLLMGPYHNRPSENVPPL